MVTSHAPILAIYPGDTVRVSRDMGLKQRVYTAISVYYDLVEIEIGVFIELTKVEKKYRNRFIYVYKNNE